MKRSPQAAGAPRARGAARSAQPARRSPTGDGRVAEPVGPIDDVYEREAERVADTVMRGGGELALSGAWSTASVPQFGIQRRCAECEEEEEEKKNETIQRAPKAPESSGQTATAPASDERRDATGPAAPARTLVVDDEADASPGQMRRSEFLSSLRTEVCATVDEALAGSGRDSEGCPWIDHWLGYYEGQSASHIERALHRYAPEAAAVRSADRYISIVTARVRQSALVFAKTGAVTGVPDDVPAQMMPTAAPEPRAGMRFKSKPGGARDAHPASVRSQLGQGRALPGEVRASMESAFGANFGRVRLHTDETAARLSQDLNARAFTIGEHVAFGAGEYRPDRVTGQALLAHELAHVVQQGRGGQRDAAPARDGASLDLERDADASAVQAVMSMAAGARRGLTSLGKNAGPRLASGLRLQRCRHDDKPSPTPEIEPTEEELGKHAVACMIRANEGPRSKTSGIWYGHSYRAKYPDEWQKDWVKGYADPEYWERIASRQWRLKKGRSASAGVKAWLKGLTIAECYATAIVSEVDAIRAAVGDKRFDELYGSEDKDVSPRLELGIDGSNALEGVLEKRPQADAGTIGNRPAKVGEWHYFTNHPQYLLKHPAGVYQGENAMLRADKSPDGEQLWEGLGQNKVTEREMYANMMADYNRERDYLDDLALAAIRKDNGGVLPAEYDTRSGVFPITLNSWAEILNAPAATVKGKKRKGGYSPTSAKGLDPKKVEELRRK